MRDYEIITPKSTGLISNIHPNSPSLSDCVQTVNAEFNSVYVAQTRLTCCCSYMNYVICAGFSGEIYFVEKSSFAILYKEKIANSIIRCMKVIGNSGISLISTDAGEMIVYDLNNHEKKYYEHSDSPIYCITLKDDSSFFTGERNGSVYEWEYLIGLGVFRNKKLLDAVGTVFALDFIDGNICLATSLGYKYVYQYKKGKAIESKPFDCNVFCIKEGSDSSIYYGLSNGHIIVENDDMRSLESHRDAVRDLVLVSNGLWMFSISKDRTVKAWYDGTPQTLVWVSDYLYQIIYVEQDNTLYFVDGHGDLGKITFQSSLDCATSINLIL